MKKKKVLLFQLPHPSFPERNIPLAASFLISALRLKAGIYEKVDISILSSEIANYAGDQRLIDEIYNLNPDFIGVSLYLWNQKRTIYILNELKMRIPFLKIIAGGPEVYPNSKIIKTDSPIDFFVFGEGENPFAELLDHLIRMKKNFEEIPNIAFKTSDGVVFNDQQKDLYEIEKLELPFSSGLIDLNNFDLTSIFLYTMRGCPYSCAYCAWSGTGKLRAFNKDEVFKELDHIHNEALSVDEKLHIFIMDSAFNLSPIFYDVCSYIEKINKDKMIELGCFVEAEFIDEHQAEALKHANFTYVETGFQSIFDDALKAVNRKLNIPKYERGIKYLKERELYVLGDIIIGLPGEEIQSIIKGIEHLKKLNIAVNIFTFSIGDRPQIAEQCDIHKMVKQADPPYYIMSSNTLSIEDIQFLHDEYRELIVDYDFNARIYFEYPNYDQAFLIDTENDGIQYSTGINAIIINCRDTVDINPDFREKIIHTVENSCSVLLQGNGIEKSMDDIYDLLEHILTQNPFTRLTIFVEPDDSNANLEILPRLNSLNEKVKCNFFHNKNMMFPSNLRRMLIGDFSLFLVKPIDQYNKCKFSIEAEIIFKSEIADQQQLSEFVTIFNEKSLCYFLLNDVNGIIEQNFESFSKLIDNGLKNNNLYFTDKSLQNRWEKERGVPVRKYRQDNLKVKTYP